MRVLILSAFLAYAAAAPSGLIAPIAYSAVGIPAIVPTISSGDIQAAVIDAHVQAHDYTIKAIDAQVQAQDLARAAFDKAKENAEQATENIKEKSISTVDLVNEKNIEALWSAEDQKWQAVDALNTAQAQVDGAVASSAPLLAKGAVGVLPYVAVASSPIFAPISPVVHAGIIAPIAVQAAATENAEAAAKTAEAALKTAEATFKTAEASLTTADAAVNTADSTVVESSESKGAKLEGEAVVKTADIALNDKPAGWAQTLIAPGGISSVYRYDVVAPGVAPIVAQPWVKYAGIQQLNAVGVPTLVKTVW